MRDLGMREQVLGRRHDLGHAALVVGAEQRRARGRDDVVADALAEIRRIGHPQHGRRDRRAARGRGRRTARWTIGFTPAPLISGEVSTCAMKPMTGTSGFRVVAGIVAMTYPCSSIAASAMPERGSSRGQIAEQHELSRRAGVGLGPFARLRVVGDVTEKTIEDRTLHECCAPCHHGLMVSGPSCYQRGHRRDWGRIPVELRP